MSEQGSENPGESTSSDPARLALEEQRARLAQAAARLRARIDEALADECLSSDQAPPHAEPAHEPVKDTPAEPRDARAPSTLSSAQATRQILERAQRLARESSRPAAEPAGQIPPEEQVSETVEPPASEPQPQREDWTAALLEDPKQPSPMRPEANPQAPIPPPRAALGATPPWLPRALREMTAHDPASAGRLLLSLLPAHSLIEPQRNLRYDLSIEDVGCLAVTLSDGEVSITEQPAPRPKGEVDFQISATLAGLALLLAGSRTKRLLSRERTNVTPTRERAQTLRLLAATPLGIRALHSAGVRLDPMLAYRALALSIEPQWTARHRFTLMHEVETSPSHRCCVYVDGERPVSVLGPSRHTHASVTVICPAELFLPLLAGELTRETERKLVHGDIDAFAALQDWIARIEWAGAYGG
jgi:hypothetical protein